VRDQLPIERPTPNRLPITSYEHHWLAKNEPMQLTSSMDDPLLKAASPTGHSRNLLFGLTLVAATFTICLVRLCGFVWDNAVDLPFEDQWALLTPLFEGKGPLAYFFFQAGPYRQGLGGVIEWYLYGATGWNVCADAWAAVVVLASATIAAIALATRLRGHLSWSDAAFPLLILSPIHWETMILTPSLAHSILPLLLTFLLAHAWISTGSATRVLTVGVFSTLILFTGYGICCAPATIGLGLLLWLRPAREDAGKNRRQAGLILLFLGGAVMLFAHGYHWSDEGPGWRFPVPNWWDYPRFCALMFTSLMGIRTISAATAAVGAVMLGLVLGAFVAATVKIWRREATARAKAVWILTGSSLVYAAFTALGRLPFNIEAAFMWRYLALMTPAVCGLALAAEGWAISRPRAVQRCLMIGWIVLAGNIWWNFLPEQYGAAVAKGKRSWIASYLRTRDLHTANREADCDVYFPAPDLPLIADRLHWLDQRHLSFFRDVDNRRPEASPP
jgi:hypothetical protein